MNGFVVIDKPSGVTSFSMVSLVRRLTGVKRVGHAGTLDPLASGVLPVAIGQAARFIEYMDDAPKRYEADVLFGVSTDTYDSEGQVTAERDATGITRDALEQALRALIGEIQQVPPVYSAIKVAGKPLYRYAREGNAAEVALAPRRVRIESIGVLAFGAGVATLDVTCGKGTYIRSLAHDLGERLGCGAHLTALRRTSSGGFTLRDARTPDALRELATSDRLDEALLAPDRAVERRPAAILGEESIAAIRQGRDIAFDAWEAAPIVRAYSLDGDFAGVLAPIGGGVWHPAKVLSAT